MTELMASSVRRRSLLKGVGAAAVGTAFANRSIVRAGAAGPPTLSVTHSDPDPSSQVHRQRMTRWGLDLASPSSSAIATLEADAGGHSDIIGFFSSWSGYPPFPVTTTDRIYSHGSTPQLCWQAQDPSKPANASDQFSYANIVNGVHDAYLVQWAQDAKTWGQVMYLRLFHEFNGTWYQWCIGNNGNTATGHIAAWRHVRDIFTAVGATNVQFVWCPNSLRAGSGVSTSPVTSCYPGDNYVDWLSFDAYNCGSYGSQGWQTVESCLTNSYNCLTTLSPGKPIMLAEVGCAEDPPNDKAAWIQHLFGILSANYPQIKAFTWATWVSSNGRDNRITSTPGAQAAFQTGTKLATYLPCWLTITATDGSGATTTRFLPLPS